MTEPAHFDFCRNDGTGQGQIRLRLDMENAYNLRSRLNGGLVSASNQLHACDKIDHPAHSGVHETKIASSQSLFGSNADE
jgi:hypothetical protein